MGKEKEMLKAILANTQLIMKHLKIDGGAAMDRKDNKPVKAEAKKPLKKTAVVKKIK